MSNNQQFAEFCQWYQQFQQQSAHQSSSQQSSSQQQPQNSQSGQPNMNEMFATYLQFQRYQQLQQSSPPQSSSQQSSSQQQSTQPQPQTNYTMVHHEQHHQQQQQQPMMAIQTREMPITAVRERSEVDQPPAYSVIIESNFTFNIPASLATSTRLLDRQNLFIPERKKELVKQCAEQLYLDRNEFYYRRMHEVMNTALRNALPDLEDPHIKILLKAIPQYSKNHWTKKGMPYHELWVQEKRQKQLKFTHGRSYQKTPDIKSQMRYTKPLALPEVRRSESELATIQSDLKKYWRDEEQFETAIRVGLEATYYERVSQLRESDTYSFKELIRQYPVLTILRWMYFEWRLVKLYLKRNSIEFKDFNLKLFQIARFLVHWYAEEESYEDDNDYFVELYNVTARSNITSRDERIDSTSMKKEMENMNKITVIQELLESKDQCQLYSDEILLTFTTYFQNLSSRNTNSILVESNARKSTIDHAHILCQNKQPSGKYSNYIVTIDKTSVFSSTSFTESFIYYYVACDIGARHIGSTLMKNLIDEAVVGEACSRSTDFNNFIVKLTNHFEEREECFEMYPEYYSFVNQRSGNRTPVSFDKSRLIAEKAAKKKKKNAPKQIQKKRSKQTQKKKKQKGPTTVTSSSDESSDLEIEQSRNTQNKKKRTRALYGDNTNSPRKRSRTSSTNSNNNSSSTSTSITSNTTSGATRNFKADDIVSLRIAGQYYGKGKIHQIHESSFTVHGSRSYDPDIYADVWLLDLDEGHDIVEINGSIPELSSRIAWRWDEINAEVEQHQEELQSQRSTRARKRTSEEEEHHEEPQSQRSTRVRKRTTCTNCEEKLQLRQCIYCKKLFCGDCSHICSGDECSNIICGTCAAPTKEHKNLYLCIDCASTQ